MNGGLEVAIGTALVTNEGWFEALLCEAAALFISSADALKTK